MNRRHQSPADNGTIRARLQARALVAVCVAVAALFVPAAAPAHFILMTPDSWMSQDSLGLPEKLGPCGNEGGGTATGKVTVFHPGETISVTINEVIPHPGHYRVALAVHDRSELPAEPLVTSTSNDPCASAAIEDPPVFPILADNMLPHTQAFTAAKTFSVTLPSDVTCTKCTLQVLETMSNHPKPCFYHHCADISIQADSTTSPTAAPPTSTATNTAAASPTATRIPICVGDCSATRSVSVVDVVTLVSLALGNPAASACTAGIPSGTQVDVVLIVEAVNNVLTGCSPT